MEKAPFGPDVQVAASLAAAEASRLVDHTLRGTPETLAGQIRLVRLALDRLEETTR
jgi:hypothetical protein